MYRIDVNRLNEEAHDYLKEVFSFPEYYGKNLDAFYDCLSDMGPIYICLLYESKANEYSKKILEVIDEVAYNNKLTVFHL